MSQLSSAHIAVSQAQPKPPVEPKESTVYFPNLDGLRFICFLAVFLYHSFATSSPEIKNSSLYHLVKHFLFRNGNLGVNFFFVLSGFLITYLLLAEKKKTSRINIPAFYMRRILRIWPLYYLCVLFGFVLFPIIKNMTGEVSMETANWLPYLVFLNNFDFISNGLPDASSLGILWSIAIEEQFYLIWPLLIAFSPNRAYPYIFSALLIISFWFRYISVPNYYLLEFHTLSCISDMTMGGIFAHVCFNHKSFVDRIQNAPRLMWIMLYLIVTAVFLFRGEIFIRGPLWNACDRLIIGFLFAMVIVEQNYARHSLFKMSGFKWISRLGIYTYGLYCLHMIGLLVTNKLLGVWGWNKNVYQVIFVECPLALLVTVLLAVASYHFYEKKFLLLKKKFSWERK